MSKLKWVQNVSIICPKHVQTPNVSKNMSIMCPNFGHNFCIIKDVSKICRKFWTHHLIWTNGKNVSKMCPKFGYNMDIILDTFCIIYQITIWHISWNILGDNWSHSVKSGHNLWQQNTFIFIFSQQVNKSSFSFSSFSFFSVS